MDGCQFSVSVDSTERQRWNRTEVAELLASFESFVDGSQRELAVQLEVPRSTLQHWLARKSSLDLDPEVVRFWESPAGVAFLHRLVLAAHLIFTQVGPCGIRSLCQFFELSRLDRLVAPSYGAQQHVSVSIQEKINCYAEQEQARLAKQMPSKQITVCEDETFHPQVCLVAIEPVSNFILLEAYANDRTADTWNEQMAIALNGLPVEIVQATGDECRALAAHARDGLGVPHSPDLFHVQQDLTKATSIALASHVRKAEAKLQQEQDKAKKLQIERDACHQQCPEAVSSFEERISQSKIAESKAEEHQKTCQDRQEQAQQAIRGVGRDYHPFDLETGKQVDSDALSNKLNSRFTKIEEMARQANLSQKSFDKIEKARRVLPLMISTVTYFWSLVQIKLRTLLLSMAELAAFHDSLLPSRYLEQAASKATTAEHREQLMMLADELLARARDGPLGQLTPQQWQIVDATAVDCAQFFQRSSSCVEGRNGQLALRYHSFHQLTPKKLGTLTALHNYFIQRPDGTTAAERFFEAKPADLFEWLLDRIPVPARPATRRNINKRNR